MRKSTKSVPSHALRTIPVTTLKEIVAGDGILPDTSTNLTLPIRK